MQQIYFMDQRFEQFTLTFTAYF